MADIEFIKNQIKDEIRVDVSGKGTASIAGASRLCGVSQQALSNAYNRIGSKLSVFLAEGGFDPTIFSRDGVPDTAVAITVLYYAYKAGGRCTEEAKLVNDVMTAIGVRSWMQQITGWQKPSDRTLTSDEIASICLLPSGRDWKQRFEDDYYCEISRLTGLQQSGYKRPALWGKLTDEWVYQMLPTGVREGVRKARVEQEGWNKLHQFLSDDGLVVFKTHMDTLLILMKAADTVNGVRRSLKNMTRSDYQYRLFEDCRKDGRLTTTRQLRLLDDQG